jgi:hypothetical protein
MPSTDVRLTGVHLAYLATHRLARLARLATIDPDGKPQNNPVSFRYNPDLDTIDIGGCPGFSSEIIRIRPARVIAFGLDAPPDATPPSRIGA